MKRMLCGIYDKKTEVFLPMVLVPLTPGDAERTFLTFLRQPGSPISEYPKDYELYEIGTFEVESAAVTALVEDGEKRLPRRLADGGELLQLVKEA